MPCVFKQKTHFYFLPASVRIAPLALVGFASPMLASLDYPSPAQQKRPANYAGL